MSTRRMQSDFDSEIKEEKEHNVNTASPQHKTFGNEAANLTFPSATPVQAQLENYIRSDAVAHIVAQHVAQIVRDQQFVAKMLTAPEMRQVLIQFFSSAPGLEILKNVLAQSPSLMPEIQQAISSQVPMHIDNQRHAQYHQISVASWNILAPSFARPQFYSYCHQAIIRIENRFRKITNTILKLKPDVICLQEMEQLLHDNLAIDLGPEYQGSFAKHEGKPDGCSLFIKSSLGQIEFGTIKLSDSKSAVLGFVQGTNTPGFWVCSVHLTGDPKLGNVRLAELKKAIEGRHSAPFLLAGDFNETEHDSGYKYLQSIGFKSACRQVYRSEPERTFKTDKLDRAIDFIFYSPHFEATAFDCPIIQQHARLPNEEVPSDHVYIRAQLILK